MNQGIVRIFCSAKIKLFFMIVVFIFLAGKILPQQEKCELNSIYFSGNKAFPSSALRDIIYSKETPWWGWKFLNSFSSLGLPPVYFDSTLIPQDIDALKAFYKANGFFKVEVSSRYKIDTSSQSADLYYKIDEDKPFRFGRVSFLGLSNIPGFLIKDIMEKFDVNSSERYSQSQVELNIAKVTSTLKDNGYLHVNLDSVLIKIDTVNLRTDLNIYMHTGSRFRISSVSVKKSGPGKNEISNALIKYLTNFKKDDFYNLSKIRESQYRLYKTGIFNSIQVDPVEKDTSGNFVPLQVKGIVGSMNALDPEINFNDQFSAFNLGLSANYTRKNFLGDARSLSINAGGTILDFLRFNYGNLFKKRPAQDSSFQGKIEASIKLSQPFMFGRPILGSLESYYESVTFQRITDYIYGIRAGMEFEMPSYTFVNSLTPYFNFEYLDEYYPDWYYYGLNARILSLTSAMGTQLTSFKTDNLQYPTKGYKFSLLLEAATSRTKFNLSGQTLLDSAGLNEYTIDDRAWFYKLRGRLALYEALSYDRDVVLGIKFEAGYIQLLKGAYDLIPPNQTFYAGGNTSVRGWHSRGLVPQDTVGYFGLTLTNVIRGGTFLLDGSFELRDRFVNSFASVLFVDYGNVWNGYKSFTLPDVAIATGFGIRYFSPIGPFRIDFGFKFYDPYVRQFIWNNWKKQFFQDFVIHFGIGEAF